MRLVFASSSIKKTETYGDACDTFGTKHGVPSKYHTTWCHRKLFIMGSGTSKFGAYFLIGRGRRGGYVTVLIDFSDVTIWIDVE